MGRKVVRRLKRPAFGEAGVVTHQPGEDLADDGTPLPDANFRVDLVVEDGDADPGAEYKAAWEITQDVWDETGAVRYGSGGQYEAGSAFSPDIRYREIAVSSGTSLLTYP